MAFRPVSITLQPGQRKTQSNKICPRMSPRALSSPGHPIQRPAWLSAWVCLVTNHAIECSTAHHQEHFWLGFQILLCFLLRERKVFLWKQWFLFKLPEAFSPSRPTYAPESHSYERESSSLPVLLLAGVVFPYSCLSAGLRLEFLLLWLLALLDTISP